MLKNILQTISLSVKHSVSELKDRFSASVLQPFC